MRELSPDTITDAVLDQMSATPDPRLKEIMAAAVRHLHAFAREVNLTPAEWIKGIEFMTAVGKTCTPERQEFILLSDTLGVSMVVDLITHRRRDGATESTVFGPFHRDGAPELPLGGNIAPRDAGMPTFVDGWVRDGGGHPIEGALLDVWQTDSAGLYDSQTTTPADLHMRGIFRTNEDGRYLIRTVRPVHYQIPSDGPVGRLLRATGRHPWRPAHIHFVVSADGYEPLTTHIFDAIDPYLKSDAVFAVKESLMCEFVKHMAEDEDARRLGAAVPFCTARFDFVLQRARLAPKDAC
jgi:hydroxyquinol 1,2-dioxygenase